MKKYSYKDLINGPVGLVFQEIDPTSPEMVYIKTGNSGGKYKNKDILVSPLFDCSDMGICRMGFADCDFSFLHWRTFYILSSSDLKGIQENLRMAIIRRAQISFE